MERQLAEMRRLAAIKAGPTRQNVWIDVFWVLLLGLALGVVI